MGASDETRRDARRAFVQQAMEDFLASEFPEARASPVARVDCGVPTATALPRVSHRDRALYHEALCGADVSFESRENALDALERYGELDLLYDALEVVELQDERLASHIAQCCASLERRRSAPRAYCDAQRIVALVPYMSTARMCELIALTRSDVFLVPVAAGKIAALSAMEFRRVAVQNIGRQDNLLELARDRAMAAEVRLQAIRELSAPRLIEDLLGSLCMNIEGVHTDVEADIEVRMHTAARARLDDMSNPLGATLEKLRGST